MVAKQSKSVFLAEVRGNSSSAGVGSKRGLLSSSTQPFKFGAVEAQVCSGCTILCWKFFLKVYFCSKGILVFPV